MRSTSWAFWWWTLLSAAAGWLLAGMVPAGVRTADVFAGDFAQPVGKPIEVAPARWWVIPYLFADFDLAFDVELAEATEFDVLLRQVEPRFVDDDLLPFHGRFTVLRLSTANAGPGWRTRDEALLGEAVGGIDLAAGLPATIRVEARGRMLRANVAGRWLPWTAADDEYGMATLIARGGKVLVQNLRFMNRGQPGAWRWSRWFWSLLGGFGGALLAAAALAAGKRALPMFVGALLPPLAAWWLAPRFDLALAWPPLPAMALLLAACLLTAWFTIGARWLAAALLFALPAGLSAQRWLHRDDRRIDAAFGPGTGSQLSEALGQLVRGQNGLHDVGHPHPKLFLLGGQLLWDRSLTGNATPGEHLEHLLAVELRLRLGHPVDVPCLPTVDGHAAQQWRLYERFFTGFAPKVIVLGVGAAENVDGRSTPEQLATTVKQARALCQLRNSRLVLFAEATLAPPFLAVLQNAGADVPLVTVAPTESPAAMAKALAAAIVPLWKP
jgi:hypothetical protein